MPIDPAKPFDLTFTVGPNWDDTRLDLYIKGMVPAMSRSKIQKYIKRQRVEVNAAPRPANWRVRPGDAVVLRCNEPAGGSDAGKHIPLEILYEDDDLVAINKQSGLVVHPVALHRHDTLLNALYWRYKDRLPEAQEISLANRLDRNTSGVILVAKHRRAKQILQAQFEARTPKKIYRAICEGLIANDSGEINLPIGPGTHEGDKCKMIVRDDAEGKPSRTLYAVIERFPATEAHAAYSLVQLAPHTGRQHQLRVHTQAIGHSIVCDDRYGNPAPVTLPAAAVDTEKENASVSAVTVSRYALHAATLTFTHPATAANLTIDAPLASDIQAFLAALRSGKSL